VVDVAAVGMERAFAAAHAPDNGEHGVRKRQREREHRHRERDKRVHFKKAEHRRRGENVAQKQRAGVAHKDLGGIDVEREKPETRAAERGDEHGDLRRLREKERHGEHRGAPNAAHARSEPVEPVDEI